MKWDEFSSTGQVLIVITVLYFALAIVVYPLQTRGMADYIFAVIIGFIPFAVIITFFTYMVPAPFMSRR